VRGNTPLHNAAQRHHSEICERLLQYGGMCVKSFCHSHLCNQQKKKKKTADPNMKNNDGKIPLELATDKETMKVLEDYDPRQKSWKWM
jgi:ankyrin repeat protein